MNAHQLDENGKILNTIVVESLDFLPNLVDASIGGGPGDSIINDVLVRAAPPASPSFNELKAEYFIEVRAIRERILNRIGGIMAAAIAGEPPEQTLIRSLFLQLRQGLLNITTIESVASATTLPQLTAAVEAEYMRLVILANTTSQDFVKAFREVDA